MKKIFIRGNKKLGDRVIAKLLDNGGYNWSSHKGNDPSIIYYIDNDGWIKTTDEEQLLYDMLIDHGEELFPEPDYRFRVGDVVTSQHSNYTVGAEVEELVNRRGEPWYRLKCIGLMSESDLEPLTKNLSWGDMEENEVSIKGYYIYRNNVIEIKDSLVVKDTKDIFRLGRQAASALAMAQISQIIEQPAYGGWCDIGQNAYIISVCLDNSGCKTFCVNKSKTAGGILRFKGRNDAELFLLHNSDLVRQYLMVGNECRI